MQLSDVPSHLFAEAKQLWMRRLVVVAIVVVCAIAAVVEAISAARIALEPAVGVIGARLVMIGVFVAIIAAAALYVVWAERRQARREGEGQDAERKVAILAEAVQFGYALARDLRKGSEPNNAREREAAARAHAAAEASATAAEDAAAAASVRPAP